MMRCPLLCGRNMKSEEGNKIKKGKRVVTLKEKKVVKQVINDKEDQRREKEVEADHRKIEEMVSKRFLR